MGRGWARRFASSTHALNVLHQDLQLRADVKNAIGKRALATRPFGQGYVGGFLQWCKVVAESSKGLGWVIVEWEQDHDVRVVELKNVQIAV
jgi:hypothetical protein